MPLFSGPDPLEKKPLKKQKPMKNTHRNHKANGNNNHHHQQHGVKPKWHRKSSAKNIIPKNVLKFPQHLPVHILDLDVNEMDDDDDEGNISSSSSSSQTQLIDATTSSTTTAPSSTTQMTTTRASSELPSTVSASSSETPSTVTSTISNTKTVSTMAAILPPALNMPNQMVEGIVLDERATSVPMVFGSSGDLTIQTPETNNTVKPVILVDDKESIVDGGKRDDDLDASGGSNAEKGYYEKTIVNKNGVFIENIRKITNIDERILGGSAESKDTDSDADSDVKNAESSSQTINRKSIELMNAPQARSQHYVITSSGHIEKTDALANDELAQFGGGGGLLANNIKNFNTNKDYNRGQEEEEQQQEPNANSDFGDYSVTTNDATGGGVAVDAAAVAVASPTDVPPSVMMTNTTPGGTTSNNCIVMGKWHFIFFIHFLHEFSNKWQRFPYPLWSAIFAYAGNRFSFLWN